MFRTIRLALFALALACAPVYAANEVEDITCQPSTTTGTGTVTLSGTTTNYLPFSTTITSGNTVPYSIVASDGKVETGTGVFTDAGSDTLTRVAEWSSDGAGVELTLPSGTHTVCVGATSAMYRDILSYGDGTINGDALKHAGKQVIWVPAMALRPNVTSPFGAFLYDSGAQDISIHAAAFDTGATEERGDFQIRMPPSWNEGTLTFQHVSMCTGCSASQTMQFELSCVAISHDDTMDVAQGTAQTSSATVTAANDQQTSTESSAITCAGTPQEADLLNFRISRDTSVDNATGDALLIGLSIFWTDDQGTEAE